MYEESDTSSIYQAYGTMILATPQTLLNTEIHVQAFPFHELLKSESSGCLCFILGWGGFQRASADDFCWRFGLEGPRRAHKHKHPTNHNF